MTATRYADYLMAVEALSTRASTLASALANAELLGQTELEAASARVRAVEAERRTMSDRLRSANDRLDRLTREAGFDLDPIASGEAVPRTLAEAERLVADLQRELTAIERNCEWLARNKSSRARTAGAPSTAALPVGIPDAAQTAPTSPTKPLWQAPVVWIVVVLSVLAVLVLVLILK